MSKRYTCGLVWLRRDLRADDNAALYHALLECERVHCAFVFDRSILQGLPRQDRRVEFIRASVEELTARIPGFAVRHGHPVDEVPQLARALGAQAVFANRDHEPDAIARDAQVRSALARERIAFHEFKDQAVFEGKELVSAAGTPYTVFTPYKKAWLARLEREPIQKLDSAALLPRPADSRQALTVPALRELGFQPTNLFELGTVAGETGAKAALREFMARLDSYDRTRAFPALDTTSRLGVHLRFGTVSIRELARMAHSRALQGSTGAATWLSELAWRDFFFQILANFPHVAQGAFRREYDAIEWESGARADDLFGAWCEGRTGFAIVDAAIAQINATGFMHNRLRMVAASFLVKDLGVDWRRGERWFAEKLNDYDLAANNGNWQWTASTGCDAQPWFRIFNPLRQQERFDGDGSFVARWLGGRAPPRPVVEHEEARQRTLRRYQAAMGHPG